MPPPREGLNTNTVGPFDKFTEPARKVLQYAQEEAGRLNDDYVDSEHFLLGLVREEEGVAAKVLIERGAELEAARSAVGLVLSRPELRAPGPGLAPDARRTIELAVEEARRLSHRRIGTEHLLLGLMRIENSRAADVLRSLGIEPAAVQSALRAVFDPARSASTARRPAHSGRRSERTAVRAPVGNLLKFTAGARATLRLAGEESRRFNHNYLGTEHLLLALVRADQEIPAGVLANLGLTLDQVRSAVEFFIGRGDRTITGDIGLTPRTKKVLELAVDEARRLQHATIGSEHLLLGLVREGQGIGVSVIESLGVPLEHVRSQVLAAITTRDTPPAAPPAPPEA